MGEAWWAKVDDIYEQGVCHLLLEVMTTDCSFPRELVFINALGGLVGTHINASI